MLEAIAPLRRSLTSFYLLRSRAGIVVVQPLPPKPPVSLLAVCGISCLHTQSEKCPCFEQETEALFEQLAQINKGPATRNTGHVRDIVLAIKFEEANIAPSLLVL